MRLLCIIGVFGLISGCAATVSTIVIGKARAPVDVTTVKLYSSPPRQFEDVALVTAEAQSGWTAQGQVDNAIAGLKKNAAQLEANGVLIETTGKQRAGAMAIPNGARGFIFAPVESQAAKGRAIHVTQE